MVKQKLILINDADKSDAEITKITRAAGYTLQTLGFADAGLPAQIRAHNPDLVLVNLGSVQQAGKIKKSAEIQTGCAVPVVLVVDNIEDSFLDNDAVFDRFSFVKRPFTPRELEYALELAISRAKMQQKLDNNQTWVTTTLKSIGDAVITTDIDGRINFMNRVAEGLTGWKLDEALGQKLVKVFRIENEFTGEPVENPATKVLREGVLQALENHTILISKAGRRIPIDDSGAPIKDDQGNISGVVLVFRDITEQRKAKNALEFEKTLIDAMLNYFPEYIYFKDLNSRFYRISKSLATEVFGINDPREAIGKSDFDFFPEQFAREDYQTEQNIIKTGKAIVDKVEKRSWANGSVSWASSTKMPLMNSRGKIIGTFGISKNITAQKEAEEQLKKALEDLRNSEEKLKNMLNGSSIPQFFVNQNHEVVLWNDALVKLSGIKAADMVGTKNHWKAFYQKKRPCLVDLLLDGAIEKMPDWYSEKYQKSKLVENGYEATDYFAHLGEEGKWIFITAVVIKDSKGKVIGALETLEDITAIKRAELERDRMIRELQEALNKVNTLQGLIPICANCKKIRNDKGYYEHVEKYIMDHSGAVFSHGICPECMEKLYPSYSKKNKKK